MASLPWLSIFAALVLLYGCQRLLAAQEGSSAARGIWIMALGWVALGATFPGSWLGPFSLLVSFSLLALPLGLLMRQGLGRRWLILLGFLALAGCIPFSSFSGYFQTFIPLMTEADRVTSMEGKAITKAGVLSAIAMLCVVYQTGALGYFYWSRVLAPKEAQEPGKRATAAWLVFSLVFSALLGLRARAFTESLRAILTWMGI